MTTISVLDLSLVAEGSTPRDALLNSRDLAQHVERWGFNRYWVAEHHNMPGIASAATSVVIGHIAAGTKSIRVGAGGVMLPNHAPLVIAEQFGTLESLFPGRIDLGVGRAPGTDQRTSYALRRMRRGDVDEFPNDVLELKAYFAEVEPGQIVQAVPGGGLEVPIWILGSSLYGAQLAAALGLPYAFASHFAPGALMQALEVYRTRFQPSSQLDSPYVMLGFNVFAADTEEQARYLQSSSQQSTVKLRRGQPGKIPPPVKNFEDTLNAMEIAMLREAHTYAAVGTHQQVTDSINEFIQMTDADELMISCSMFDHSARLRSYEIVAEAVINQPRGSGARASTNRQ